MFLIFPPFIDDWLWPLPSMAFLIVKDSSSIPAFLGIYYRDILKFDNCLLYNYWGKSMNSVFLYQHGLLYTRFAHVWPNFFLRDESGLGGNLV